MPLSDLFQDDDTFETPIIAPYTPPTLSERIRHMAEGSAPFSTAIVPGREIGAWIDLAEDLETDARDAWRSFWVAAAVVAVLIVFAVWQRFDLAPPAPAQGVKSSPVMYA